jgi:mono/diheme cytochrome c family protein
MIRVLPPIPILMFLVAWGPVAAAQGTPPLGDAAAGKQLALRSCSMCHIVAQNQDTQPMPNYGPNFSDLAQQPRITAASLYQFLTYEQRLSRMPHPDLTPSQIADVSAYLLSLREQP